MSATRKVLTLLLLLPLAAMAAGLSEIKVNLRLDGSDFVVGQRVRGIVDIANSSPDRLRFGHAGDKDRFFVEIFRSEDGSQMTRVSDAPFVSAFDIRTGEGQKLETFLGDHYALRLSARYLAKPVLVHGGVRYEGAPQAFDIVDGVRVGRALQMFANHRGLQREFELVYWSFKGSEHLYLKAQDAGSSTRRWETRDLGPILHIDKPSISIMPGGEVIVLHRLNLDQFVRSEFWSLADELLFRRREAVADPETAGTQRVRELYKKSGVKPKENPWWKFW